MEGINFNFFTKIFIIKETELQDIIFNSKFKLIFLIQMKVLAYNNKILLSLGLV